MPGMPGSPMVYRPHVETRIACGLPGLGLAAVVTGTAADQPNPASVTVAVLTAACGVVLAIRSARMAVVVDGPVVTVRGMLRTRVIPRGAVEALLDADIAVFLSQIPTLYWCEAAGQPKRTGLWMFGEPGREICDVTGHNRRTISHLRTTLGIGHTGNRRHR